MADQEETPKALLLVADIPDPEQEKDSLSVPEAEDPPLTPFNPTDADEPVNDSGQKTEPAAKASDLPEDYRKALHDLKRLVRDHDFGAAAEPKAAPQPEEAGEKTKKTERAPAEDDGAKTLEAIEETIVPKAAPEAGVFIWGVNLMEDDAGGRSDVVLLKFLRARDFRPKEAFAMLKETLRWRKEFFGVRESLDLDGELGKAVFMHGRSREGNPVCYNVYGGFRDKELYRKLFSDEEKRERFLRWRVMFLEKSVRELDLGAGGISTIVQVNDLKNCPGPYSWELRQATNRALQLLQDNYPEFVAKQVFINVPWWYVAASKMISPFLTQRSKSKFVVAGPSKSTETLLKYISAEQIPRQYGGLSSEDGGDFGMDDNVTEVVVKPSAKHTVEFLVSETCSVSWEVKVVGWEVSFGAEFVPSAEDAYTVIIHKTRKIGPTQEQVICGTYKVGEPGKLVLTIDNLVAKKKMLFYRFKAKPCDN